VYLCCCLSMIRRPPRTTQGRSSAASDGYKGQELSHTDDVAIASQDGTGTATQPYSKDFPVSLYPQVQQKGYLYTDRPIYRAGETVHLRFVLRTDDDGRYSLPFGLGALTLDTRDSRGNTVSGSLSPDAVQTTTYDGIGGFEFEFDTHRSHVFVSGGARANDTVSGDLYYHEQHLEYSIAKYVEGPYSMEVTGRYRSRKLVDENLRGPQNTEAYWHEGDNYVALKIAPKWVFSQGFEYTTQLGFPTYYFNGSVLFKPRSDWAIRAFAGQQRGQFLCLSGVCKFFPPYEGGRVDVTLRF